MCRALYVVISILFQCFTLYILTNCPRDERAIVRDCMQTSAVIWHWRCSRNLCNVCRMIFGDALRNSAVYKKCEMGPCIGNRGLAGAQLICGCANELFSCNSFGRCNSLHYTHTSNILWTNLDQCSLFLHFLSFFSWSAILSLLFLIIPFYSFIWVCVELAPMSQLWTQASLQTWLSYIFART